MTKEKKIPKFLQPYLWSVKVEELGLRKDRVYIINQILAFGDVEALEWLFKNYSIKKIRNVFYGYPIRIYRDSGFNFVKNILLDIKKPINSKKYVAASI